MSKKEKITLTRKALYDLVWSKPTKDVAHDLQMSDVALAKWCRKMDYLYDILHAVESP